MREKTKRGNKAHFQISARIGLFRRENVFYLSELNRGKPQLHFLNK